MITRKTAATMIIIGIISKYFFFIADIPTVHRSPFYRKPGLHYKQIRPDNDSPLPLYKRSGQIADQRLSRRRFRISFVQCESFLRLVLLPARLSKPGSYSPGGRKWPSGCQALSDFPQHQDAFRPCFSGFSLWLSHHKQTFQTAAYSG